MEWGQSSATDTGAALSPRFSKAVQRESSEHHFPSFPVCYELNCWCRASPIEWGPWLRAQPPPHSVPPKLMNAPYTCLIFITRFHRAPVELKPPRTELCSLQITSFSSSKELCWIQNNTKLKTQQQWQVPLASLGSSCTRFFAKPGMKSELANICYLQERKS